jgi:hypothetical protein
MNLLTIIKDYQSGLGALVGFLGVMTTLFVNAWLGRRQHSRKIAHERRAVRAGLLADLVARKQWLQEIIEILSEPIPEASPVYLPGNRRGESLYQRLLDKVIHLTPNEITKVADGYNYFGSLSELMQFHKLVLKTGTR